MKRHILRCALQWLLLISCGEAVAQGGEGAVTKRPLGERYPSYEASAARDSIVEPDTLRLGDALALALMHNPHLATFSWEVRAREAARLQAGVWPNPEIGFEYENFNFAASGSFEGIEVAEATLVLSQLVLLGDKRGKRSEVARLDKTMADWDYETTRIATYAATAREFIGVLAAQERLALTEKIVEVARDIRAAVSARVRAGGTLALEENRASVALESSRIERMLAERDVAIARRRLAATWGGDTPRFTRAAGRLDAVDERTPSLDSLLAGVDRNPRVARWTAELHRRRALVELIKADNVPDLNLLAGVRHFNDPDGVAFVVGVAAPLPVWDRKRGAIGEAQSRSDQVAPARAAEATRIERDIAVAYEVLEGALAEITGLQDRVLPEADAAATSSGNAYRAGAIQLTDVLDIQRTFFRLRLRYVNALARYHGAVVELEGLTGAPLFGDPLLDPNSEGGE